MSVIEHIEADNLFISFLSELCTCLQLSKSSIHMLPQTCSSQVP
jgi:hypothetical protein